MFAAESVSRPLPSLVSVPAPVPIVLLIVVFPEPPTVSARPEPVIVPLLSVSRPASELIRVAAASVTAPAHVLLPLMLRRAPPPDTPEPLSVSGRPREIPFCCCRSISAFEATVTAVDSPRAALFCRLRTPAFTEVVPVNALDPVRICVPAPVFTRLIVPAEPLERAPSNWEVPELSPIVNVAAEALPSSTVPEPVSPATVAELPLSRKTAPLATLTALVPLAFKAPVFDSWRTPPFTFTPPVNVLFPPSTSVPVDALLTA